ncbi:MAG TPA: hypothetical protein EYQ48_02815 [Candidatus Lambdaproteobacteria bacterium]|nr:hypothetical protein [Candidatus Lambdaproteobacteria bacterium]
MQIHFVKALTITILFFIQILGTAYAQEKQKACLAPMGALGDISEMQKQIIFNSLQESLSTQYVLASQKAFESAQTQAFDDLEYDECTEDQCFALIQQILQVDNLFLFNMTREGNFTQLSLTRVDLDSQRLVRTSSCVECNIEQLNKNVDELVLKIIDEDQISTAGTKIKQEPLPEPEPAEEPVPEPEPTTEPEKSPSSDKTWHYVAISVTLVSALMSYNAANSYNDLSEKNKTLATQYANSSSSSEKDSYKSEYDSNASQMNSYESSFKMWDMLTLAGLGWETYLLLTDDSEETAVNYRNSSLSFIPRLSFKTHSSETQTVLLWKWRF